MKFIVTRPFIFTLVWNALICILGFIYTPLFSLFSLTFMVILWDFMTWSTGGGLSITGIIEGFKLKKVTTEFGRFYISIGRGSTSALLFEDKIFYLKLHKKLHYSTPNIESLKSCIKREVKDIYIEKIRSREVLKDLESWDGTLDKEASRDKKINKILN